MLGLLAFLCLSSPSTPHTYWHTYTLTHTHTLTRTRSRNSLFLWCSCSHCLCSTHTVLHLVSQIPQIDSCLRAFSCSKLPPGNLCLVSASSLRCHLPDETALSALGEFACHRHSVLKWMLSVIPHTSYFMTGSAFFLLCLLECPLFFSL